MAGVCRGIVLAVDVGATWTRVALASRDARILAKTRFRTPRSGGRLAVAKAVIEASHGLLAGRGCSAPEAVGVGTIGPLDLERGRVVGTPNLPLRDFDLGEPLAREFGAKTVVVNDCVAGVWAEKVYGVGGDNLVYITMSTGVGGGVVVDGHLLLGKQGNAHEIGHIVVDVEGRMRCGCGGRGHWEAYAGGANIPRYARLVAEEAPAELRRGSVYEKALSGTLGAEELFRAAEEGDAFARYVVESIARYTVAGLASVANTYDPEVILLGGPIVLRNPGFRRLVAEMFAAEPGVVTGRPRLEEPSFGEDQVLVGAAAIATHTPAHLLRRLRYNR